MARTKKPKAAPVEAVQEVVQEAAQVVAAPVLTDFEREQKRVELTRKLYDLSMQPGKMNEFEAARLELVALGQ